MSKNKNVFSTIRLPGLKYNWFNLTHDVKMTCNMGELRPTLVKELLPGDTWKISNKSIIRVAPMLAPLYHRVDVKSRYFWMPNRAVWKHWDEYIRQKKVGGTLPAHPFITVFQDGSNYSKLMDSLGIPDPLLNPGHNADEIVNVIPFAVYQAICDAYFKDGNFPWSDAFYSDDEDYKILDDGDNSTDLALFPLRRVNWEHDRFTSLLPATQAGDAVALPLGTFKDVPVYREYPNDRSFDLPVSTPGPGDPSVVHEQTEQNVGLPSLTDGFPFAQTSGLEATATIADLRTATAIQKYKERILRAGTRFTEWLWGVFGQKSGDARLQRPEYIGGCSATVAISEVLQTSETGSSPQGNLAGHGVALVDGHVGSFTANEHGYLMCITYIVPKPAYMQGLDRHWLKFQSPYDYFTPDLANLGERAAILKEIYAFTDKGSDTFGYEPQYNDYRYATNRVCGDFKSTLAFWTLVRKFEGEPILNSDFMACDPSTRIFAVDDPDYDHFWCDVLHELKARRPVPKFGTPALVG